MRRCPNRHRGCWVLAFGKAAGLLWCYQCGALRDLNKRRWTYPTGINGENPAIAEYMRKERERYE